MKLRINGMEVYCTSWKRRNPYYVEWVGKDGVVYTEVGCGQEVLVEEVEK